MHFGMKGESICGGSRLEIKTCTTDVNAVTCTRCLWQCWGQVIRQVDEIAGRIRAVVGDSPSILEVPYERS